MWGFAAVAIVHDGLNAIQHHRDEILIAEAQGKLTNPACLATCRRRVAEVTGAALPGSAGNKSVCGLAHVRAPIEAAAPCHAGANV